MQRVTYLTTLLLILSITTSHTFLLLPSKTKSRQQQRQQQRQQHVLISPPKYNYKTPPHLTFSSPQSTAEINTNNINTNNENYDQALLDSISSLTHLPKDATRIFHGRGNVFPKCEHLTLDWFNPVFVLTSFQNVTDQDLNRWHEALSEKWGQLSSSDKEEEDGEVKKESLNWIYQCRATSPATTKLMSGSIPNPQHVVTENNNSYLVHVMRGQNHGLFLDMSYGRSWVQNNSKNKKVLNLFAYTCAFSVVALAGGANEVVNVDMSKGALKIGQKNHELNGLNNNGSARFLGHNIFKTWGKIKKLGPYDVIVVDPPSYQKGSFVAEKDYIKLVRRLPTLLSGGGYVLLCLNAPELNCEFLHGQVVEAAPELEFVKRIENPPTFPAKDEEKGLKVLLYRLPKEIDCGDDV